jgi:hypothetical protein
VRRIAEARWLYPSKETRARYLEVCVPLYTARARIHPDAERRMIRNDGLALHFSGEDGEFLKLIAGQISGRSFARRWSWLATVTR